jgi:hypothetical protein
MEASHTGQSSVFELVAKLSMFVADIPMASRRFNIERFCLVMVMRRTGDGEQCDEIPECTFEDEFVTQTTLQLRFRGGTKS